MIKLYTSTREIKGTDYFELLPGPYRNEHWGANSVFMDEETFGFIEPIFVKLCPKYGHYALTEIGRPLWQNILEELDALSAVLEKEPTDEVLSSRLGFFYEDTEREFYENRTRNVAQLRQMLRELTAWVRGQLSEQSVISVLGI